MMIVLKYINILHDVDKNAFQDSQTVYKYTPHEKVYQKRNVTKVYSESVSVMYSGDRYL